MHPAQIAQDPARPARAQRARGEVHVAISRRDGANRLDTLYQKGSAKLMLPRVHGPVPHAVVINTAGGITGGDRFLYRADAGPGADLVLATQTAERIYRRTEGHGEVETRLTLGAGARLDWLAQETILFEGSALRRRLSVDMAEDARLTLLEPVILGRTAMGEALDDVFFSDQWRIRRGGHLVFAEATRIGGGLAADIGRAPVLSGGVAFATILHVAPDAEDRLDAVRGSLGRIPGWRAGVSLVSGCLVIRCIAKNGVQLRKSMLTFFNEFRAEPLPRVWYM